MRKSKVTVDFIKYSPINKANHYHTVIDHMSNNPLFPTPDATLIDAQKVADALDKAILAASTSAHHCFRKASAAGLLGIAQRSLNSTFKR